MSNEPRPQPVVLLVDDNIQVIQSLTLILTLEGCAVEAAENLAQAEKVAAQHDVALALCDYSLAAGESGLAVPQILANSKNGNEAAKTALLTGHSGPQIDQEAEGAGFDVVLLKPPSLQTVRALASEAIAKWEKRQGDC